MKIFILFSIIFTCGFLENFVSNAHHLPYKTISNIRHLPYKAISNAHHLPYEAIFNFGDSISDTGNAASNNPGMPKNSPYGSTYFKHPSGRMSDGRLIIDFIAEAYGLPMLPPFLNMTKGDDVSKGVNFAYAGSTALDKDYFMRKNINVPEASKYSLRVQLDWFKKLKPSLCKECNSYFKKSLFLVGEVGGNDINAFIPYKNITQLREMVPSIIETITNTTSTLIEEGAVKLVVPGNFPIGCNSAVLTIINSDNKNDYDQHGCLKSYNDFIEDYNGQLKQAIKILRQKNPQVEIIYFDYYGAAKRLFQEPHKYGFSSNRRETFKACCGKGQPYNFDMNIFCGSIASTVCSNPSKHINWDGAHFTEAAYKQIAKGLIEGPFAIPSLKSPPFKIV